jgi:hypothetical protein
MMTRTERCGNLVQGRAAGQGTVDLGVDTAGER